MILEKIKSDKIVAMKAKDNATKQVLIAIIDQAEKNAKRELREVQDSDVISSIRTVKNKALENVKIYSERNVQDKLAEAEFEISVANQYLPKETSAEEILAKITEVVEAQGLERSPALIKVLMPALKTAFGANLNGKMAQEIVSKYIKLGS